MVDIIKRMNELQELLIDIVWVIILEDKVPQNLKLVNHAIN